MTDAVATDAVAAPHPSRQAARSAATRTALLQAAEQIFARDGFEAARIEDIALAAGRSRGAFYANFGNKTELFLALRQQLIRKRAREIREIIHKLDDVASRGRAIEAYLVQQVLEERQLLLEIEFKLFALRRPAMLEDLSSKHLEASCRINREELVPYLPEWQDDEEGMGRKTLAIEAILEGLALNHLFHGSVLCSADVALLLPGLIDHIVAIHAAGSRGNFEGKAATNGGATPAGVASANREEC